MHSIKKVSYTFDTLFTELWTQALTFVFYPTLGRWVVAVGRLAHILEGVVTVDTQISQDTLGNRDFSLIFHENRSNLMENSKSWIFTVSKGVVGNLGVDGDHPPRCVQA